MDLLVKFLWVILYFVKSITFSHMKDLEKNIGVNKCTLRLVMLYSDISTPLLPRKSDSPGEPVPFFRPLSFNRLHYFCYEILSISY